MFISRSMTRKVIVVDPDAGIDKASELMESHNIRHLPVVDAKGVLVGLVSNRDIRSAMPSSLLPADMLAREKEIIAAHKVKDIMAPNPTTVSPQDTIQDALLLIQKTRVGAFPVVDADKRLKGIVSTRDLLRSFVNVLGIGEPGTLLCILVEDQVGQMKRIVDAITDEKISIGSILVARHWEDGKRAVFPYLFTANVSGIKPKLEDMGYTLLNPMDWYLDRLPRFENK